MNVIEFECVKRTAKFGGFCYAEDLDDDECIYFYDATMQPQSNLQNAYFEGEEADVEALAEAFCEDGMFLQFLADYCDESATIDRGDYVLLINGGESSSSSSDFEYMTRYSKVTEEIVKKADIFCEDIIGEEAVFINCKVQNADDYNFTEFVKEYAECYHYCSSKDDITIFVLYEEEEDIEEAVDNLKSIIEQFNENKVEVTASTPFGTTNGRFNGIYRVFTDEEAEEQANIFIEEVKQEQEDIRRMQNE